jgi:hypothetical protein
MDVAVSWWVLALPQKQEYDNTMKIDNVSNQFLALFQDCLCAVLINRWIDYLSF